MGAAVDMSAYSDPIAQVYEEVTDNVIVKIARGFQVDAKLQSGSVEWQMLKLAQLGKFTDETARIIAAGTRGAAGKTEAALYDAVLATLDKIEPTLLAAAKGGYITATGTPILSDAVKNTLHIYSAQAASQLNLVNTVMLNSARKSYLEVVANTIVGMKQAALASAQAVVAQQALNTATGAVVLGAQSRQEALFAAIRKMAQSDIIGFVDNGGHNWSAEAYVNMDIRTTAQRTAIEAQKARSAEYGIDTFQISTKAAARPLCAPYQGWICSWSNRRGTVTDIDGATYTLHAISDTSYGEPAGIFGINCGHHPAVFIPGYSTPTYSEPTAAELKESDAQYKMSQEQRLLERGVRIIKREAAALSAAGAPDEMLDKYKAKIKEKTAALKSWAKDNERTYRADRVHVEVYNMENERRKTA